MTEMLTRNEIAHDVSQSDLSETDIARMKAMLADLAMRLINFNLAQNAE